MDAYLQLKVSCHHDNHQAEKSKNRQANVYIEICITLFFACMCVCVCALNFHWRLFVCVYDDTCILQQD